MSQNYAEESKKSKKPKSSKIISSKSNKFHSVSAQALSMTVRIMLVTFHVLKILIITIIVCKHQISFQQKYRLVFLNDAFQLIDHLTKR